MLGAGIGFHRFQYTCIPLSIVACWQKHSASTDLFVDRVLRQCKSVDIGAIHFYGYTKVLQIQLPDQVIEK